MKRFNPEDEQFISSVKDYLYLLDKGYPQKSCLKLVGDRYKLISDARTILYRGITSSNNSIIREKRLISEVRNHKIILDTYNVLFILLNYITGKYVFISSDNMCRDAGSLFGKIKRPEIMEKSLYELIDFLISLDPFEIIFYFDSPVSHSKVHKDIVENSFNNLSVKVSCYLVKSADHEMKNQTDGILATSDSAIIDETNNSIVDIPRKLIEEKYGNIRMNLKDIVIQLK